ncbi:anaerobic ribonucleoside-triphosphate reductase activating protein [Paenibacillus pini]|uniref:Anaerobic ribonucleoside-triphosphate reductase-activating protein n=2 Tax=Paenibacillus TaxID=44249 RepID=W7YQ31_9BACL|nr:ribonucleotide reductase [Paenibacillus pini JCM 16418]
MKLSSVSVMSIIHDSVVDGEGLRTVIFFSGCTHQCPGCHNPQSWNVHHGTWMSVDEVLGEVLRNPMTDVTLSGGDPFMQPASISCIARGLKLFGKHIWAYTGYTMEELLTNGSADQKQLLSYCDVLVDGPFKQQLRDVSLAFRGSSNQMIWQKVDGVWFPNPKYLPPYCNDNRTVTSLC